MREWPATSKRGWGDVSGYVRERGGGGGTFGRSSERGRKRVPREGPPTYGREVSLEGSGVRQCDDDVNQGSVYELTKMTALFMVLEFVRVS